MSPQIDADGVPDRCLTLTIRSAWGHFRKVGRTATKQTYRVIPRTTVAGLLAAIVGAPRDSYYDVFGAETSAVAITPLSDLRTLNMPKTVVGTDPDQSVTKTVGSRRSKAVTYQDSTEDRQIHVYETLIKPAYRIDVAVDDDFHEQLRECLTQDRSHYPPSMGVSQHLASVELEATEVTPSRRASDGPVEIESIVPGSLDVTVPQPGVQYSVERSPAVMESIPGGRRTTRFDDYVFTPTADTPVSVDPSQLDRPVVDINGRTVVFR
jgi:CRISPR-associated protein Cas5h